jgi:hypothetical protein
MTRPVYSLDAPDQQRLKIARLEIEAILAKHDLAGCVVLHTPGMSEFFYSITPSYSVCWLDEKAQAVRIKSKLDADHGGDAAEQMRSQAATANMTAALAGEVGHAALMFLEIDEIVTKMLRAEHTPAAFVPDPREGNPS